MRMLNPDEKPDLRAREHFATTQWNVVIAAGLVDHADARAALATLCEGYWIPLYAYVRRRVSDVAEAQDLTQEFFAQLLEKDLLAVAAPERGRFRSFLLTALKNFLTNQWHKARAEKRGGGRGTLSLNFAEGDSRLSLEPSHDRKWALTLLDRTLNRLGDEYRFHKKGELFDDLRPLIGGNRDEGDYAEVAEKLRMTAGAAKAAAYRMRNRYRELLRDELAATVADPADIDDEIAWLFQALE